VVYKALQLLITDVRIMSSPGIFFHLKHVYVPKAARRHN